MDLYLIIHIFFYNVSVNGFSFQSYIRKCFYRHCNLGLEAKFRVFQGTHHHHHQQQQQQHVELPVRISLNLSRHPSLSAFAPRRSSRLYPVLAQGCCIEVLAGCPAFAHPWEGVHRSILLMSSSLLLQESRMCGSSKFSWWVVESRIAAVLRGIDSRTCFILPAVFLCNCRQALSPYVQLASM